MTDQPANPSRRTLLRALALSPAVAAVSAPAWAQETATSIGLISPNVCMVMPEVTEGPYYIDPELVRADVTEDRVGIPFELAIQVVTADCEPVADARVDIWHCDAAGNYSGFSGQGSDAVSDTSGETFLRGTQMTGEDGVTRFITIYPGWYRGRTPHIHYKVFLDERTVLTSQIFFPDALSQYIYENVAPYNDRSGDRDTYNNIDNIAQQAGDGAYAAVREQSDRYVAALVVGIDQQAESVGGMGPGGGDRPAGPPPDSQPPQPGNAGEIRVVPPVKGEG